MTPSIHGYSMAPVSSTTQPQSMAPTNVPAYASAPGDQLAQQRPFSMPYGHLATTIWFFLRNASLTMGLSIRVVFF